MDTSNSINKIRFITGDLRIPADKITPTEWRIILDRAVKHCKPYIKYFPDYHEIAGVVNDNQSASVSNLMRRTPRNILKFDDGLALKTRFHWMTNVWTGYDGTSNRESVDLMLSNDGRWFVWRAKYKVERMAGFNRSDIHTAIESEFRWAGEGYLEEMFENHANMAFLLLQQLTNLTSHAIEEKKDQFEKLSVAGKNLQAMLARVRE